MENVESIAVVNQKTKTNGQRIEKLEQGQELLVAVEQRAKSNTIPAHSHGLNSHTHTTGTASNLPPYLAVYVWKRTA